MCIIDTYVEWTNPANHCFLRYLKLALKPPLAAGSHEVQVAEYSKIIHSSYILCIARLARENVYLFLSRYTADYSTLV